MDTLKYDRFVIGYHGLEKQLRDEVLAGKSSLKSSENDYDWLGKGIYFWEFGKERAMEWAEERQRKGRLKEPSVIGAVIHLGNCFDLLDVQYTKSLGAAYPEFEKVLISSGKELPENTPVAPDDPDFLLRRGDCAVVNWTIDLLEKKSSHPFHTVRGVFQEGGPAFPGSHIREKSHIQIAVRNTTCLLGYFLPR